MIRLIKIPIGERGAEAHEGGDGGFSGRHRVLAVLGRKGTRNKTLLALCVHERLEAAQ